MGLALMALMHQQVNWQEKRQHRGAGRDLKAVRS